MTKLTRRGLAKSAALAAGGLALHVDPASAHGGGPHRPWKPEDDDDIALVNGNFITLADDRHKVTSVAIRGDRIVEVGRGRSVRKCKRTIDLKGATVIPGLIDSHQHFIRACHNPGYETRAIEAATSIAEVQKALAARAKTAPAGSSMLTPVGPAPWASVAESTGETAAKASTTRVLTAGPAGALWPPAALAP